MKIEHLGVTITEVPGMERITVRPHDDEKGSVQIWIRTSSAIAAVPYTIDELTALIDALTVAGNNARFMEERNSGD